MAARALHALAPALALGGLVLGCGDPREPDPEPTVEPAAGRLIRSNDRGLQSAVVTNLQLNASGVSLEVDQDVLAHQITYWSTDADGEWVELSALVAYPTAVGDPLPVLSYQHGTLTARDTAPSWVTAGPSSIVDHPEGGLALILAASGYLVVAPDYVGLGVSETFHPYLHAETEASAVVDALRASREFAAEHDVELSDQLFLTGLSQGGHATMAAHRALERDDTGFEVTASAPVAGPYRLSGSAVDGILADRESPHPYQAAYLLLAYNRTYGLYPTDSELFVEEVADTLPTLFDGAELPEAIDRAMVPADAPPPKAVRDSVAEWLLEEMAADEEHPLRVALRENDVDDWSPRAPIRLYHCRGDQDVPFEIAEHALETLEDNGADVELIEPQGAAGADHQGCFPPSLSDMGAWFAKFQ